MACMIDDPVVLTTWDRQFLRAVLKEWIAVIEATDPDMPTTEASRLRAEVRRLRKVLK